MTKIEKVWAILTKIFVIQSVEDVNGQGIQERARLFFLHIPKNAGSSVNRYITSRIQPFRTHIETERGNQYSGLASARADFLSGHIRLAEANAFLDLDGFIKMVLLRRPVDQLVSHINWVMRLSEDSSSELFLSKPKVVQQLSLFLRGVDFGRMDEVRRFMRELGPFGQTLFNNCQTRYLSASAEKMRYETGDGISVLDNLAFFDFVGFVEDLDAFIAWLSSKMGWVDSGKIEKVNAMNNIYNISFDGEFRDVVAPLLEQDQVVYDAVVQMKGCVGFGE